MCLQTHIRPFSTWEPQHEAEIVCTHLAISIRGEIGNSELPKLTDLPKKFGYKVTQKISVTNRRIKLVRTSNCSSKVSDIQKRPIF